MSDVVRIDSSISFHLSKLSNAKFSILYDISLVRDWKRKSWLIIWSERVNHSSSGSQNGEIWNDWILTRGVVILIWSNGSIEYSYHAYLVSPFQHWSFSAAVSLGLPPCHASSFPYPWKKSQNFLHRSPPLHYSSLLGHHEKDVGLLLFSIKTKYNKAGI